MPRRLSKISPAWWDYTTLDDDLIQDAAKLTEHDLLQLSRPGFEVILYDTLEEFYLCEALEYIDAWRQATADNPAGICGPIGPTEQLPLVARLVNELDLDVSNAHFWGMPPTPAPPSTSNPSTAPRNANSSRSSTISSSSHGPRKATSAPAPHSQGHFRPSPPFPRPLPPQPPIPKATSAKNHPSPSTFAPILWLHREPVWTERTASYVPVQPPSKLCGA